VGVLPGVYQSVRDILRIHQAQQWRRLDVLRFGAKKYVYQVGTLISAC
jgi:hypothetical protein